MEAETELHWADILVFTAVLIVSAAIGLYYAIRAKRSSPEELLMGQRQLPVVPVIFSLSVSFVSAVSVLGVPAEIYANGSDYWLVGFGYIWALALTGVLVLPVIYKLKLTSAYEYLELRFSKPVRLMASFTFIFLMVCYMAVVLYAPALALSSVTRLSMEVSILTVGGVCTLYTALGGIRAVIWTDVFQTVIITAGLLVLIGRGVVEVGGVSEVVGRVINGSRDATYPMDLNPFKRHTFWTLCIGGGFGMMAIYAGNQATLQRYLSVDTLNKSRIILFVNIPLSNVFLALMCLSGLVMYAYYQGRDPLHSGRITKRDQLLPLFVWDILHEWRGLPGLFIACVFSAALSTVSSGVNSLATVTVEDFIKPAFLASKRVLPSAKCMSAIAIATALFYGLLTIGVAYLCGLLSAALLTIVVSILGMMGGPLLGVILIGLLCPWVNSWQSKGADAPDQRLGRWFGSDLSGNRAPHLTVNPLGAGCALVSSLAVCMWTAIGAITQTRPPQTLTVANISDSQSTWDVYDWYSLSYQHYATLAVTVSLLVGTVVSMVTGCNRGHHLHGGTYYDILKVCRSSDSQKSSYDVEQNSECDLPSTSRKAQNVDTHL